MSLLNETLPKAAEAYEHMTDVVLHQDNFLDLKTKELVAIVASVLVRCQPCVDIHLPRGI
jgi:alkylhydroperoxidase/carboxymuconolactone decarboxylase family protein YurZ